MLERNHAIFAVGDIHGSHEHLLRLLQRLPVRWQSDLLIFMGDYINRGPDTRKVLDTLISLRDRYPNVVFLKGNHEHLLLEYAARTDVETLRILRTMGIEATLESYGATVRELPDLSFMPQAHREFLRNLSLSHTAGRYVFVHADTDEALLAPDVRHDSEPHPHDAVRLDRALSSRRLAQEYAEHDIPERSDEPRMDEDEEANRRIVVFAHAPFETPFVMPDRICVDTGAVYDNLLTAVELPLIRFYHA